MQTDKTIKEKKGQLCCNLENMDFFFRFPTRFLRKPVFFQFILYIMGLKIAFYLSDLHSL